MQVAARRSLFLSVLLLAAASVQASAHASLIGAIIHVDASSLVDLGTGPELVTGGADIPVDYSPVAGQARWVLDSAYVGSGFSVTDSATHSITLGYVDSVDVGYGSDPFVKLNVLATAGDFDTTFTFTSASVSFAPLTNVQGVATAQFGATDNDGDGVSLTGLYAGGKAYQAFYNPGDVLFASLVSSFSGAPSTSPINTETSPTSGTTSIPGTVSSIRSQISFTLSAGDSMGGTNRFTVTGDAVVPEPSTMALFAAGLVGLAFAAARRRFSRQSR